MLTIELPNRQMIRCLFIKPKIYNSSNISNERIVEEKLLRRRSHAVRKFKDGSRLRGKTEGPVV